MPRLIKPLPINTDAEAVARLDSYERRGRAFMLQQFSASSNPVPLGTGFSSRLKDKSNA
jgi:hypothetical protein